MCSSNHDQSRAGESFATTRWSLVSRSARPDATGFAEAIDELARRYRPAICTFLRSHYHCQENEAEDLTQSFLTDWIQKGMPGPDPDRGPFRAYLRGALRNFVLNHRREQRTQKRGGGAAAIRIGEALPEAAIPDTRATSPEEAFDAAYRRELFARAVQLMDCDYRREDRTHYMRAFRLYYIDPPAGSKVPTYRELATELGASVSDLTNWLAHARARLRQRVVGLIRDSVTDEGGFRAEIDALCGRRGNSA